MKTFLGTAEPFLNDESLGFTLKSNPFTISTEIIKHQFKTNYSADIWSEKIIGSTVTAELTLPYTEENVVKFPNNKIITGSFRVEWLNKELTVEIPNASLTFTHNFDMKNSGINSISVEILALNNGTDEKITISEQVYEESTIEETLVIKINDLLEMLNNQNTSNKEEINELVNESITALEAYNSN